jgi:LysR family transcriptional regulator, transcription activator of glutamate synthase operon
MDIKQVQYFLKVAELGNYSAAAAALYVSQSSLSKQILALEKELGFQLFDRSKRKIAITPAGETFLRYAQEIERAYLAMLMETRPFKAGASLSIVAIPVIAQYGITTYIAQFQRTFPDAELILEEREANEIIPALSGGPFELAFLRDNYLDLEQFTYLEVARDRMLVVLSGKHRLAGQKSLALAECSDENFILFDKGTVVHELAVEACRRAGFEPRVFYASLRVESILGMVADNSGIALMMERVFAYHQRPDVLAVPLEEAIESRILLASQKNKPLSRNAKKFFQFMKERLGTPPFHSPHF